MRSRKAIINMLSSMVYQFVAIVCGLILPRLILSHFGSGYNGLTSSISQFISCVALMKAGLFGVTRSALYKPLAEKDEVRVSAIVNTTEMFMRKIAVIFAVCLILFSMVYPFAVKEEYDYWFTVSLFLIIGISTFFQYYFGMTYSILLEADQRQYVVSGLQTVTIILNTSVAAVLINMGFGIRAVKAVSAIAFSIFPILQMLYARRHFQIDKSIPKDNRFIEQRWAAFAQEVAFFVHNNTDVIILTFFADMKTISVYTVYNYVISNLLRILETSIIGFGAAFGNMLAKGEQKLVENNLKISELIVFSFSSVLYSTAAALIVPFALLYTKGVNDANYSQPVFGILITLAGMFSCFRIPYKTIVDAAGHFRQMRNGALLEASLNLIISAVLVIRFGLIGVAIGTLVATVFRSAQYARYLSKILVPRSMLCFSGHVFVNLLVFVVTYLSIQLMDFTMNTWTDWIWCATVAVFISTALTVFFDLLLYKAEFKEMLHKVRNTIRR